jgi:hypothetical protein
MEVQKHESILRVSHSINIGNSGCIPLSTTRCPLIDSSGDFLQDWLFKFRPARAADDRGLYRRFINGPTDLSIPLSQAPECILWGEVETGINK